MAHCEATLLFVARSGVKEALIAIIHFTVAAFGQSDLGELQRTSPDFDERLVISQASRGEWGSSRCA